MVKKQRGLGLKQTVKERQSKRSYANLGKFDACVWED